MIQNEKQYYCINCGEKVKSLYKKYSETVLKLTECEKCKKIADKYVEYDLVVIIIDLILFDMTAYRHILLNSEFKNFWKLSLVLILLESYSNWSLSNRNVPETLCGKMNKSEPDLNDFDINVEDMKFYIVCINVALSSLCFLTSIFICTKLYHLFFPQNKSIEANFVPIMKTVTLSSTGLFLQLPSLIWDISIYDHHLHFITLYTSLSQLLAYRVICNCPKLWCLAVIFSSHIFKAKISTFLCSFLGEIVWLKY